MLAGDAAIEAQFWSIYTVLDVIEVHTFTEYGGRKLYLPLRYRATRWSFGFLLCFFWERFEKKEAHPEEKTENGRGRRVWEIDKPQK
ncbi:hypothetical protein GB937_005815 [Aspergillus fischeri]|nr:hypothetical protein GB937_005815 [Aspergillus fischeri]